MTWNIQNGSKWIDWIFMPLKQMIYFIWMKDERVPFGSSLCVGWRAFSYRYHCCTGNLNEMSLNKMFTKITLKTVILFQPPNRAQRNLSYLSNSISSHSLHFHNPHFSSPLLPLLSFFLLANCKIWNPIFLAWLLKQMYFFLLVSNHWK